ncbi:MAG TPA: phospholipase A [Opitutaceae bacterium]|nr:phospholipase A [Opitutaceae bacterium]HRJ46565.1 phospholipase A [Opitutaceae bacterium]
MMRAPVGGIRHEFRYLGAMRLIFRTFCFLLLLGVGTVRGVIVNLAGPIEAVGVGAEVGVELVLLNPAAETVALTLPGSLSGRLSADHYRQWPVQLQAVLRETEPVTVAARGFAVRDYVLRLPAEARGRLVLELPPPFAGKLALEVHAAMSEAKPVRAPLSNLVPPRTVEAAVQRTFARRFSAHEPIYFIYGNEAQAAKFQFSFRYRIAGAEPAPGEEVAAVHRWFFGFTQRSLWDITAYSSPFYDTSYMPELFFESQAVMNESGGFKWLGYQAGARHESNGRTGFGSRSLNTVYFRPGMAFGRLDGWNLIVAPRIHAYVSDLSDNDNIRDYRGNVDLLLAFGKNDRLAVTVAGRLGRGGHRGSVESSLTIPVKFAAPFDFATYFMLQYWSGYGESLLDYNVRSTALRAGFSLVR